MEIAGTISLHDSVTAGQDHDLALALGDQADSIALVVLAGEVDHSQASDLRIGLANLFAQGTGRVIVDLM